VLSRMANGTHPDFYVKENDTIIFSSKVIPGNEKLIFRLINRLISQGARVIWDESTGEDHPGPIHASGHGRREEIAALLKWVDPKVLIPVHGNVFQMKEVEKIAHELRERGDLSDVLIHSAENGDIFEFALDVSQLKEPERTRYAEYMPKFLRFDGFVSPSLDPFLRKRKRAASGGVVSVVIDQSGRFRTRIDGLAPQTGPRKDLLERAQKLVDDFCTSSYRQVSRRWPVGQEAEKLEQDLSESLARDLRKVVGARPATIVHLVGL